MGCYIIYYREVKIVYIFSRKRKEVQVQPSFMTVVFENLGYDTSGVTNNSRHLMTKLKLIIIFWYISQGSLYYI